MEQKVLLYGSKFCNYHIHRNFRMIKFTKIVVLRKISSKMGEIYVV